MALLASVAIPGLGHTVNGSTRWLDLGPLTLQPSEPARLCLMLYIASYIVRHQ
jgi:cell division protein FtsW